MMISKQEIAKIEDSICTISSVSESLEITYTNSENQVEMLSDVINDLADIIDEIKHRKIKIKSNEKK
jgi:hypothetical protein